MHDIPKIVGHNESCAKKKVHNTMGLKEKIVEIPTAHFIGLGQKEAFSHKMSNWQEVIKLMSEINYIESNYHYKDVIPLENQQHK